MKELILVRHAKSSWAFPELEDQKRPLNKRGNKDAPYMAAYLREKGIIPDKIISSPAKRAFQTAKYFHTEFNQEVKSFDKETDLYFGSEKDWLDLINNLDEEVTFPAYFSHNPSITYFSNQFATKLIDNVPTCGIIYLQSSASLWSDLDLKNTKLINYFFPKLVRDKDE